MGEEKWYSLSTSEKWYSVSTKRMLFIVFIPLGIAAIVANVIIFVF